MDRERTELIKHPEQPGTYEFTLEDWHRDGFETFELTEDEKFEIREMAAKLVNHCIMKKVPIQVFAIGGLDAGGELMMNVGNLWPPCRVPASLLVATSIFKDGISTGMNAAILVTDLIKEEGPRKPAGGKY